MSDLVARERAKYDDMWTVDAYAEHSPGEMLLPIFRDMAPRARGSILDAGCGSGKGALALTAAGFDVTLCDLTDAGLVDGIDRQRFRRVCLWEPLAPQLPYANGGKFDWVYCCDVLEHVPESLTMLTIARLLDVAREGLFLSISLVPDHFGVWIGHALHQTVKPFVWWRDQLSAVGDVVEGRDLLASAAFLVRPRC